MQGNTEITNITNNLNDLSEVIRLTQTLSRKVKDCIVSYHTWLMGYLQPTKSWSNHMINDMAKRQLGVESDDALNQNI